MPPRLMFVQLEFTHAIGPQPGVYLLGPGGAPVATAPQHERNPATGAPNRPLSADTLMVGVVPGPPARRALGLRRRPVKAESGDAPRAVALALVTLVRAATPLQQDAAATLLQRYRESEEMQEEWIAETMAVVNTAIRAHRAAAVDPYVSELSRVDPRAVRIGYGTGSEIAAGRWEAAIECPPLRRSRLSRAERLRPSLAVAGALGRRLPMLEAQELLLRVLLDLDEGRPRGAGVQAPAALGLLLAELGTLPVSEEIRVRLSRLSQRTADAERLAQEAQRDELPEDSQRTLSALVEEMLGTLGAWQYETLETAAQGAAPEPAADVAGAAGGERGGPSPLGDAL